MRRAEGVANWFQSSRRYGSESADGIPGGQDTVFSDTMEELAKSPEALEIAAHAVKLAANLIVITGSWHVGYDEKDDTGINGRSGEWHDAGGIS